MPSYERRYYQKKQRETEARIKYLKAMKDRKKEKKISFDDAYDELGSEKCTLTGAGVSAM